jgi:putative transposase
MKGKPAPGTAEPQLGSFKNLEVGERPLKNAELGLGDPRKEKEADLGVGDPGEKDSGGSGPKGWYSRGYLPHYDECGALQMITYRLGDSLPQRVLEEMEETLALLPEGRRESVRRQQIEEWLDAGLGSCVLSRPEAARCVVETWGHFDGFRYGLVAGVVMPNHVHVLIRLMEGVSLGKVVQSWKSYTGRRIAGIVGDCRAGAQRSREEGEGRSGGRRSQGIWMREYWDRFIRDEKHFAAAVEYIHMNPVKAGLVEKAEDWYWSTAGGWGKEAELGLGGPREKLE